MNFILVPFLLAVRLKSDDYQWRHGPEYTFNVSVANVHIEHRYVESRVFTLMKCRPEEPDSLRCRFKNGAFAKSYDPPTEEDQNLSYAELDFGNEIFEIKFNEDGIEKYVFQEKDEPVNETVANLYRLMANQLSIWSKIRTVKQRTRLENTVVGTCDVDYEVSYEKADNETTGREYQLVWLINEPIRAGQKMRITRKVQLQSCSPRPVYTLANRVDRHRDMSLKGFVEKMGHFISETRISKYSFESDSMNRIDVYDSIGHLSKMWFDLVHLSLISVDPARCADMSNMNCRN